MTKLKNATTPTAGTFRMGLDKSSRVIRRKQERKEAKARKRTKVA